MADLFSGGTQHVCSTGFVYIVGAGPGDPDLLTIKATKVIAKADVILIDDLVDEGALIYAKPTARVQWVGKRGGCISTPQAFIEKLMVHEAHAGHVVVRLKGGDPTVFGRLGEELVALNSASIPYEVVSGLSSGLAAASSCGISLTHRDHSHGVVFVTGHAKPNGQEANIGLLVKQGLTTVVYMGLGRAEAIVNDVLAAGCDSTLSVAIVEGASTAKERVVATTLGALVQAIGEHQIKSPALIVIGKVTESIIQPYAYFTDQRHYSSL
jgi:uroporphyrin-III C-methyltransferase